MTWIEAASLLVIVAGGLEIGFVLGVWWAQRQRWAERQQGGEDQQAGEDE
jgi:hypothetical protein